MQPNLHISILAIAIAAMLSLLLAAPAAAHPRHGHDRQVVYGAHLAHVVANKGGKVVLGKHSVMSVSSQIPACACCSVSSGYGCGSGASMPCGSGFSGAALPVVSSVAGALAEANGVNLSRLSRRLFGRIVGPLDKPPRV